jgi:hypothetical protein
LCCTSHSEAILATYRLIKRWVRNEVAFPELSLWMGQASDEQEARAVYLKIQQACQRFLEVGLAWEGHLAEDPADLDSREQDFFAEMGWSATGKPGLSERLSVQPAMTIPRLPATREELLDLLLKLATSQPFQNMRFSPLSVPLPQSLHQAGRLVLDARQRPYVLTAVTDDDRDRWTGGLALSQWFQDNLELIGGYCRVTLDPLQKPGMVVLTSGPRDNEFKTLSSLTGMSVYHAQFLFTEINQILAMILA